MSSTPTNQEPQVLPMSKMMGEKPFRLEDKGSYLKFIVHGTFDSVSENTTIVEELYSAANDHSVVEVWINSEGGFVSLLIEIIEALKQFDTVITICNSSAFSAGAMLWSFGDIRVTSNYATIGFHRESYGFYGKTDQHSDLLEHQKKIYPILLDETCGDILTEEEKERARVTEIYFTGKYMIDEKHAVSFEDYSNGNEDFADRMKPLGTVLVDQDHGTMVMVDQNGRSRHISAIKEQSPYEFYLFDYLVSNKIRTVYDHDDQIHFENKEDFEAMVDKFYSMISDEDQEELSSTEDVEGEQ